MEIKVLPVHVMKQHEGMEVQLHLFLISALIDGHWPSSSTSRFTPEERGPGTH
jgi:hypothetical protein